MNASLPPIPEPVATLPVRHIGSIWRRLAAFLIDSIVIGIAADLIAFPLFDTFSRLGLWGRLVGFLMALPYFAILNSAAGNGQTLGKRALGLQVVNREGIPISFPKSALRYAVLWTPFFLNQLPLPVSRTPAAISLILALAVFGLGGANIYLPIFNRSTRQGPHDLAAGTYVVAIEGSGAVNVQPIWKGHWFIVGLSVAIILIGSVVVERKIANTGPFPQLLADARMVESMNEVQAAGVQDLRQVQWGVSGSRRILVVTIFWKGQPGGEESVADSVARAILQNDATAKDHDALQIIVTRGFDLGIAHGNVTHNYAHSITDWNARLGTS